MHFAHLQFTYVFCMSLTRNTDYNLNTNKWWVDTITKNQFSVTLEPNLYLNLVTYAYWSVLLTKYISGDQTEKNVTVGTCGTYGDSP